LFLIACFPPLFSVFTKPFLAFPKIAHLVLKVQQNQKSYFVCPFQIGLLRNLCASPFGQSKAQYDEVSTAISDNEARYEQMGRFITVLKDQEGVITEFDDALWSSLVEESREVS
jgi:hypothetical protein